MIEKFAMLGSEGTSEFLDLHHTSNSMILVSLMISKFARGPSRKMLANIEIGTLEDLGPDPKGLWRIMNG